MNYLKITNKGLIEPEDLYLIGSSTKRDDDTKIGMFGSGWKFALAWLMRNDSLPIIMSGQQKIDIDYNVVLHRNTPVKVITIDGRETSLTSEMGMKWTGWMAIREIVSNAIDEGDYKITTVFNPEQFTGEDGGTSIYIPLNSELGSVLMNYDNYFSFERKESYSCEHGRIFFKKEKSKMTIYRKGIRCYDTMKETKTDFDFNEIDINESRLTSDYEIKRGIQKIVRSINCPTVLKKILEDSFLSDMPNINDDIVSLLCQLINLGEVLSCPMMQGIGGIFLIQNPTIYIPNDWYRRMAELGHVENPFSKFSDNQNAPTNFIETNDKDISWVKYYLEGFNLSYNFYVGIFDGDVSVYDNNAYINAKTEMKDKEIASRVLYCTSRAEFEKQMK